MEKRRRKGGMFRQCAVHKEFPRVLYFSDVSAAFMYIPTAKNMLFCKNSAQFNYGSIRPIIKTAASQISHLFRSGPIKFSRKHIMELNFYS